MAAVIEQVVTVDVIMPPIHVVEVVVGTMGPQGPQGIQGPPGVPEEAPVDGNQYARQNATWTRVGLFPNGTVAVPSISFASEPNTGMYHASDGVIGYSIKGTQRFAVNGTGVAVTGNATASGDISASGGLIAAGMSTLNAGLTVSPTIMVKAPVDAVAMVSIAGDALVPGTTSLDLYQDGAGDAYINNRNATNLRISNGAEPSIWLRSSGGVDVLKPMNITANVAIFKDAPTLFLHSSVAGTGNHLTGMVNTKTRWDLMLGDTGPETGAGSNAGSNFALHRYSDTGVFMNQPIFVQRSDGAVMLAGNGTASNAFSVTPLLDEIKDPAGMQALLRGTAGNVSSTLDTKPGSNCTLWGTKNGLARWNIVMGDNAAETGVGSATGSNFNISCYNDGGGLQYGNVLYIARNTGFVQIRTSGESILLHDPVTLEQTGTLQTVIDALNARIEALTTRLAALESPTTP